jgi:hemoglobin/transferrin/lactoferrin receptor protein
MQFSNSSNIYRYDLLTDTISSGRPRYSESQYGPETRGLASYQLDFRTPDRMFDRARLIVAGQYIAESRFSRKFQSPDRSVQRESVGVGSVNFDMAKQKGKHEIRYGIEAVFNYVNSTAHSVDIETNQMSAFPTRYPDGSGYYYTGAAYLSDAWEISKKVIVNFGGRATYVGLKAFFEDTTTFQKPFSSISKDYYGGNGSLGLIYSPSPSWRLTLAGSSGFRAPNLDDLGKLSESGPGSVVVPNPDLKPEYTANADLGLGWYYQKRLKLDLTLFGTYAFDYIGILPAIWNGQDSIQFNGEMLRTVASQNTERAYIIGGTVSLQSILSRHITVHTSVTYTYGRLEQYSVTHPLDHVPPIFGKTGVILRFKKVSGEFWTMYNGWKRPAEYGIAAEDNLRYASIHGTPAWFTINARFSYQITRFIGLHVALENIIDQRYRLFASGISAPGRNLIVTLRGSF